MNSLKLLEIEVGTCCSCLCYLEVFAVMSLGFVVFGLVFGTRPGVWLARSCQVGYETFNSVMLLLRLLSCY